MGLKPLGEILSKPIPKKANPSLHSLSGKVAKPPTPQQDNFKRRKTISAQQEEELVKMLEALKTK